MGQLHRIGEGLKYLERVDQYIPNGGQFLLGRPYVGSLMTRVKAGRLPKEKR